MLAADNQSIVLHDRTLDRTTDGHGFAADLSLEQIRRLDAGTRFDPRLCRNQHPHPCEVLDWAKHKEMGLFLEIKEIEQPELVIDRLVELLAATGTADRVAVIGFDHVLLNCAERATRGSRPKPSPMPAMPTFSGAARPCGARSVAIESTCSPGQLRIIRRCRLLQPAQSAEAGRACGVLAWRTRRGPRGRGMDRRRANRESMRRRSSSSRKISPASIVLPRPTSSAIKRLTRGSLCALRNGKSW